MNALFNEYLTGVEREAAIMVAESDAQFAKLNVLYEAVNATVEANMLAAEAKVFAENGTYDDLAVLYAEAANEGTQKKEGIIATIINAISTLLTKLGNFISSKFGNGGSKLNQLPGDSVNLDKSFLDRFNIFKKFWDLIKGIVQKITGGQSESIPDISDTWKDLVEDFGKIGAGAAAATVVVKRHEIANWIHIVNDEIKKKAEAAIKILKGTSLFTAVASKLGKNKQDEQQGQNGEQNQQGDQQPAKKSFSEKALDLMHSALVKLQWLVGKIGNFLGSLYNAIPWPKKDMKEDAKKAGAGAKDDQGQADEPANGEEVKESTQIFGYDLSIEETFMESELTAQELAELDAVFVGV